MKSLPRPNSPEILATFDCKTQSSSESEVPWKSGVVVLLAVLLCLASCSTTPKAQPASYWVGYLASHASVYGYLKTGTTQAALEPLTKDPAFRDVLARTSAVFFSLEFPKNAKSAFRILALGDYPKGWTGFALESMGWKKPVPAQEEWWNPKTRIYVVHPETGAVMASSGSLPPDELSRKTGVLADKAAEGLEAFDLAFVLPRPAESFLGEKLGRLIPIVFIRALFEARSQGFEGRLILSMKEEKNTRIGLLMAKLAISAWLGELLPSGTAKDGETASESVPSGEIQDILGALKYEIEGDQLIIRGFRIPYVLASRIIQGILPQEGSS